MLSLLNTNCRNLHVFNIIDVVSVSSPKTAVLLKIHVFWDIDTCRLVRRGWVVSTKPRPLYPREIPGTHCTGGCVGPRAGMNVWQKSGPYWDPIPGPSSS
jgi:hypothetical protein